MAETSLPKTLIIDQDFRDPSLKCPSCSEILVFVCKVEVSQAAVGSNPQRRERNVINDETFIASVSTKVIDVSVAHTCSPGDRAETNVR